MLVVKELLMSLNTPHLRNISSPLLVIRKCASYQVGPDNTHTSMGVAMPHSLLTNNLVMGAVARPIGLDDSACIKRALASTADNMIHEDKQSSARPYKSSFRRHGPRPWQAELAACDPGIAAAPVISTDGAPLAIQVDLKAARACVWATVEPDSKWSGCQKRQIRRIYNTCCNCVQSCAQLLK